MRDLNRAEEWILGLLGEAWNVFNCLDLGNQQEFMQAIHAAQNIVLSRPACQCLRERETKEDVKIAGMDVVTHPGIPEGQIIACDEETAEKLKQTIKASAYGREIKIFGVISSNRERNPTTDDRPLPTPTGAAHEQTSAGELVVQGWTEAELRLRIDPSKWPPEWRKLDL